MLLECWRSWAMQVKGMGVHGSGNPGQQTLTLVPFLAKKT